MNFRIYTSWFYFFYRLKKSTKLSSELISIHMSFNAPALLASGTVSKHTNKLLSLLQLIIEQFATDEVISRNNDKYSGNHIN